jgi:ankyrin repeat protein
MPLDLKDDRGRSLLHLAAFEKRDVLVPLLISWKVDVNACDHEKMSALHLAALSQDVRITRQLLCAGADKSI